MAKLARGEGLVARARAHVGEAYDFVVVPKNDPDWRGPQDCAELASYVVYQEAGVLYGCNRDTGDPATADAGTIYWGLDARRQGKIISVAEAAVTPGAAVLRIAAKGGYGHIVVSDGKGGTIEAASHRLGVIKSTLSGRRWDMGILVPGIQYAASGAVVLQKQPLILRLKSPRMTGDQVYHIQEALGLKTDGIFGPQTMAAALRFQQVHGLIADGEVGPQTAAALGVMW